VVQQKVRAPVGVVRVGWRRRFGAVLLAGAAVLTFACVMGLLGARADDMAIDARTGRTTAEVMSSTFGRTIIRFVTPDGAVHSPQRGVLYPRGLEPGQLVRVEYDRSNPDLVRVADRDFRLGLWPFTVGVTVIWLVLAPPALWLRRRPVVTLMPKSGGEL
jgi:hypothetical protein